MQCARHPKVETGLACSRCGTPICPKCSVSGPVGMRCRECASLRTNALYRVHPARFALAIVVGMLAGTILGVLLHYAAGLFFYCALFAGPIVGGFLGDVILRVVGHRRGVKIEVLAGFSVVGGAFLAQFVFGTWEELFANPIQLIVFTVAVVLAASAAIGRIRHL